jgi:hypothetical protein
LRDVASISAPAGAHQHAGDAADGHDRADRPAAPMMRQQEHGQKRADARLHVGHEEIQRLKRRNSAPVPRSGFYAIQHPVLSERMGRIVRAKRPSSRAQRA